MKRYGLNTVTELEPRDYHAVSDEATTEHKDGFCEEGISYAIAIYIYIQSWYH